MNVAEALRAICTTGVGYCWYCDHRLPSEADEAIGTGWDVKRLEGERVASIILVCPECTREKTELGKEGFSRNLFLRECNTTLEPTRAEAVQACFPEGALAGRRPRRPDQYPERRGRYG